jgi:hypothetical protein
MDRELYSIEQARALLGGIARNTIYSLIGFAASERVSFAATARCHSECRLDLTRAGSQPQR